MYVLMAETNNRIQRYALMIFGFVIALCSSRTDEESANENS